MKKVVFRYGLYAGLGEFVFFVLVWLIIDITHISHRVQGYLGYVAILCPMVFVYFGIRYYRDRVNNGSISFLQALKVGMLIIIIPAVSYSIIETVYVTYIDPHFYENIAKYDLEQYRKILSPAQYAAKVKEMSVNMEMFKSPFSNFMVMILTMAAWGTIVAVISALLVFRRAGKVYNTQSA
jgi:ABC-type multidrug transport system permease subunit